MKFSRVGLTAVWVVSVLSAALLSQGERRAADSADSFYPVAVWYGGGKARAPMLERLHPTSADHWGKDLDAIKATGFCIDHAAVRKEVTRFLEALSREANLSPALYGWDVWSEPHVVNWAEFPSLTNPEFCYCDSSQARFRVWLKAKYKTLGALNAAWYRNITLPQALRVNPTVVLRHAFDWAGFYAFGRTQLQQGILDRRIASWPGRHGNAHCGSRGAPRGRILDVGGRGARGA